MKSTSVKGFVTTTMVMALAAGTMMFAGTPKAQAQQFAVGFQYGQPAYVAEHDGYRDRDDYRRGNEYREHEAREAYERQQAYLRHEQWEAEQREANARRHAYIQHEYWEHHQGYDRHDYR